MKTTHDTSARLWLAPLLLFGSTFVAGCSTTKSDVQNSDKPTTPAPGAHDMGDMQLPPGWTAEDMQACMTAGTPGPKHEMLAKSVGTWTGTSTMWMAPGTEPMTSTITSTITSVMDGRYTRCEVQGEMAGMGAFHGLGYSGFDNVSQKFVSSWMDNHSSGIMNGEGKLSADGKTLTWTFEYNCPITKKPAIMREVDHFTSDDAMTMEMFGKDPKSGVEFKMMKLDMKRQSGS